jgi:hypothetical protein
MTAGHRPRWISAATRLIGSLAMPGDRTFLFPRCDHAKARGSWSLKMDYAKPADVVASMVDAGVQAAAE